MKASKQVKKTGIEWFDNASGNKGETRILIEEVLKRSQDTHNNYTPLELCAEIVEKLRAEGAFTEDAKTLVVSNLEFVYVLKKLYLSLGYNIRNIYFLTPCISKRTAANNMGVVSGMYSYDELDLDKFNMKFDVIVGNPPYQAPNKFTQSLWPLFIEKLYELANGYCSLVVPSRWCSHTYNIRKSKIKVYNRYIRDHLIYANIGECSRHFADDGYSQNYFSYFIIDKNRKVDLTEFKNVDGEVFHADISAHNQLPYNLLNKTTLEISKKIDNKAREFGSLQGFVYKTKWQPQPGIGKYIVAQAGRYATWDKVRFMIISSEDNIVPLNAHILSIPSEIINSALNVVQSRLYKFILLMYDPKDKYDRAFFKSLPAVDFSKVWYDQDLYKHFGLTQKEIEYIESVVK